MSSAPRLLRIVPLGSGILFGITCLTPAVCFGGLTWDSQKIEVAAELEETQAKADFRFKNTGTKAVTITEIKPSCGCTAVELAKRTYAPGESGEIKTVTTFGGSLGTLEKNLVVTSDDASLKPATLVLRVTIPELFTYNPRLLLWRLNEDPTEQSAIVTCRKELAGIEINPDSQAGVVSRVEPVEAGKSYRIFLRPKSSAQPVSLQVPLIARLADHTTRPLVLYVLVR